MANLTCTKYGELRDKLDRTHKYQIRIGRNTTAEDGSNGRRDVIIRLHGHPIVKLYDDNHLAFTMAGWGTVTTRDRINQFLPVGVYLRQSSRLQYIHYLLCGPQSMPIRTTDWYSVRFDDSSHFIDLCPQGVSL